MRISLAGRIAIEAGETTVDEPSLGGPQARAAFAFLVLERDRLVTHDEIADVLWGDTPPESWKTSLRGVLHRVRRFLGAAGAHDPDVLESAFGCCRLRLPAESTVDVEEAQRAVEEAEHALATGQAADAWGPALAAHAVAGRGFLPGQDGAWISSRQRALDELARRAGMALGESRLATGETGLARQAAEEVIAVDPLHEGAHLLLIRSHAADGNRAEALRAYERCRALLVEELGVDPGIALQAAYRELLGDEPTAPTVAPTPARLPAPLARHALAPPFVGRSAELARLSAAWDDVSGGAFRIVLISGEPGIGKTRLAAELAARVHAGGDAVLYGRADPDVNVPYRPVAEALGRYLAEAPPETTADLEPYAADLARLLPTAGGSGAAGLQRRAADRYRLFDMAAAVLGSATRARPTLLVLDDLHWADDATLAMLRHLAASGSVSRLLLLAAHRDTEPAPQLDDAIGWFSSLPHVDELHLGGLGNDEVGALAALAGVSLAPTQVEGLRRDTAGNPFFVSELVAAGMDRVPPKVRQVVAARLARLPAPVTDVVRVAAVVGPNFAARTVIGATDHGADAVLDALDAAERAGLVVPHPQRNGRIGFVHELVRAAVYEDIPSATAQRLHRRVGWTLENDPEGMLGRADRLAHHFVHAAPLGDWRRAGRYSLAAAEQAADSLAFETAATRCATALDVLEGAGDPDVVLRCDLETLRAASLRLVSDESASAALWQAARTARHLGDAHRLARVALAFSPEGGSSNDALMDTALVDLYEEALSAIGDGAPELRSPLLGALAAELAWGRNERYDTAQAEAITIARSLDDRVTLARVLTTRRHLMTGNGPLPEQRGLEDELIELGTRLSDDAVLARAWTWRFETMVEMGDGGGAGKALDNAAHLAAGLPQPTYRFLTTYCRGAQALFEGRVSDAEALVDTVDTLGREAGIQPIVLRAITLEHTVGIRLEQQRLAEIEADVVELFGSVPVPVWTAHLAMFYALLDRRDDAAATATRAAASGLGPMLGELSGITGVAALGFAAAVAGDTDLAAAAYEAALPHAGRGTWATLFFGPVDWHLARMATALGRADDAAAHRAAAVGFCQRLGAPLWAARCALPAD